MAIKPYAPESISGGTAAVQAYAPTEVADGSTSIFGTGPVGGTSAIAPTGKTITVVDKDGRAFGLDEAYLPQAKAQGYAPESHEMRAVREYVDENKGLTGAAKVAFRSFINEATFGVTDAAIDHMADPLELKKAEALKRDHAAANILGGVGGFATSMLYGGEFFDAARVAGKGAEALVLGGKAAAKGIAEHAASSAAYRTAEHAIAEKAAGALVTERLIQAGVPVAEAAAAGPGIARKIAASAAGMGVEGAIFTAPKALTEAAFGDTERAGETLLYGLGGGALLGAAGPAAKSIYKAAASGIGKVSLPGSYRELAGKFAEEQAFKSLASNHASLKKAAKEAMRIDGGQRGIGRELLDSGLVRGVKEDVESYAERLAAGVDDVGEQIGGKYAEITAKAGADGRVAVKDLIDDFVEKVAKPLGEGSEAIGREGLKKRVDGFVQSFGEHAWEIGQKDGFLALDEAHRLRRVIDKQVNWSALATTEDKSFNEALAGIRTALDKRVLEKAESVAEKEGGSFVREIKELNLKFQRLKAAEKAAADFAEVRKLTNRSFSPTDYGVGGIGALASPLSAIGGVAAAVAHKFVREEGNAVAAKALDRYSKGAGIAGILEANHAAAQQLERVGSVLSAVASGKSAAAATLPTHALSSIASSLTDRRSKGDDVHSHFAELAERLTSLQSDPARMQGELQRIMEPFESDAPGITAAMVQKSTAAVQHLNDTMPRAMSMPGTPLSPARVQKPTASQIADWGRRWQVVQDPFIVMDRIADGSLTRTDIETLGAVYPRLRQEISRRVQMWAAQGGKTLPGAKRQKLSLALGMSLDPTNYGAFQALHEERSAKPEKPSGGGKAPKMPTMQTDVGRLTMKG